MYNKSKQELFDLAVSLLKNFSKANSIKLPSINLCECKWHGYYRDGKLFINLKRARTPGRNKFSYTFPGNSADLTPIGILAHEFGHYVDDKYLSTKDKKEWVCVIEKFPKEKVTSYEPNYQEKFAESFKLFITNPNFLKIICPNRYNFIVSRFKPSESGDPLNIVKDRGAYPHIIVSVENKIKKAL